MLAFKRLREEHLPLVMRWRMQPEVTRYMLTDPVLDETSQRAWFRTHVQGDPHALYWVIHFRDVPIGLINVAHYVAERHETSYGYYLGDAEHRHLGGLIPPYFYNHLFSRPDMDLHRITAEVLAGNRSVIGMLQLHGFRETGRVAHRVIKHGEPMDAVLLELTREAWAGLHRRFGHQVADFE